MTPPADPERSNNHRLPGAISRHGVWRSSRVPLSARAVHARRCARGIDVTHAAIRPWCLTFGQDYAHPLQRRRAQPGDTWHVDEVVLTIHGKRHALWRAVDQDDNGLESLVQRRRNQHAAKQCLRPLRKGLQDVSSQ